MNKTEHTNSFIVI